MTSMNKGRVCHDAVMLVMLNGILLEGAEAAPADCTYLNQRCFPGMQPPLMRRLALGATRR